MTRGRPRDTERDRRVLERARSGQWTSGEVATAEGIAPSTVFDTLRAYGARPTWRNSHGEARAREDRIVELVDSGIPQSEVARREGVSRQRIHTIVNRARARREVPR